MSSPGFRNYILGIRAPELPPREELLPRDATGPLLQSEERSAFVRYNDQAQHLLQGISRPFSTQLHRDRGSSGARTLTQGLTQARRWIRDGYREGYYFALRDAFLLLPHQDVEQNRSTLREMTAWVQDYQNILESGEEYSDYERFRYLYATTQFTHATLRYLQDIPPEMTAFNRMASEWIPLFENLLRQLHRPLIRYYTHMEQNEIPSRHELTALYQEIRLQEALWENHPQEVQRWSQALRSELQSRSTQPGERPSWVTRWEEYFLQQPNYLSLLDNLDLPSPGEAMGAWVNGFSSDILMQIGATLDLWNEDSEREVQLRYQVLGLTLAAWNQQHPELDLNESLAMLYGRTLQGSPESALQNLLENSEALAPRVQAIWEESGVESWEQWWGLVHEGLTNMRHWHTSGGSHLLEQVLELNRGAHPIRRLAEQLQGYAADLEALHLPTDPQGAAQELFRRGAAGREELTALAELSPHLPIAEWLETLNLPETQDQSHEAHSQELLEFFLQQVAEGEDHETAAAAAVLHLFTQETEAGDSPWNLPTMVVRRSGERLTELQSLSSRTLRILSSLVSTESLATMGFGVLYAELLPALAIGRLGRATRLARLLAPRGHLRTSAALAHGLGTGVVLGTAGAVLQNHARSADGFRTHYAEDILTGATINSVVFCGAAAANLGMHRFLGRSEAQTHVLGRTFTWRPLLAHGASLVTGGSLAWGLGVTARGMETGRWETSGDEAASHYLTFLGFELGGAGLRQVRRRISMSRELGMPGSRIGRSLGPLFVNEWMPVLGPTRTQNLIGLLEHSMRRNPALRGRRQEVLQRLAREEYRHPGITQNFEAWMRQGHTPVMVGPEGRQHLVLLAPEAMEPGAPLPEVSERPTPLLLPANTQSEGLFQDSSVRPQYQFSIQTPEGEVRSDPQMLDGTQRRRILLNRESFQFLEDPAETRVLPREGFGLLEYLDDGAVTLRVPERLSDLIDADPIWRLRQGQWESITGEDSLPETLTPDLVWHLREGNWHRLRPGSEPLTLDPGTTLAFGRLYGKAERVYTPEGPRPGRNNYIEITSHDRIPLAELQMEADSERGIQDPLFLHWDLTENSLPPGPIHRVALDPGDVFPLESMRLMRNRSDDRFRLVGPARQFFQIARMGSEGPLPLRGYRGVDQPEVGEIGDTILLRIFRDGRTYTTRLLLDDLGGSASLVPEVRLRYGDRDTTVGFRPSQADLNFGRLHQPHFFNQKYISRNHFDVRIAVHQGQPRYWVTVRSNFGLWIQGRYYLRGESVPLRSGRYQLRFPIEAGNDNPNATDGPMELSLPPLTRIFSGWKLSGLSPNHDHGRPPLGYPAQESISIPESSTDVSSAESANSSQRSLSSRFLEWWSSRDSD